MKLRAGCINSLVKICWMRLKGGSLSLDSCKNNNNNNENQMDQRFNCSIFDRLKKVKSQNRKGKINERRKKGRKKKRDRKRERQKEKVRREGEKE